MPELIFPMLNEKKKLVAELSEKMKHSKTILVASTKNLPSSQFHKIKKLMREKAEIKVARKSILIRAIAATEKGALQNLKEYVQADIALFFSNEDAFELARLLAENQTPTKAKPGEIALEDISIEPGPTDLLPGPAISELSGIGLKVAVEGGKIAIKGGATVAKKGTPIKENVASVLGKLNVLPMKVGFIPIAAYDSVSGKVYINIKIDQKATLEELRDMLSRSFSLAVAICYFTSETITYIIRKAALQERALETFINNQSNKEEAK